MADNSSLPAITGVASPASMAGPPAQRSGPAPDIGSVIARVFDLLEGSRFEPVAADIACGLVNGARLAPQR